MPHDKVLNLPRVCKCPYRARWPTVVVPRKPTGDRPFIAKKTLVSGCKVPAPWTLGRQALVSGLTAAFPLALRRW